MIKEFSPQQLKELSALVSDKERFSAGISNRENHRRDISCYEGPLPAAIIWPDSTAEVARIMAWVEANNCPLTPWGAGTSTEGNPVPIRGGLVMDMTTMNKILAIRPEDLQADVQPGVFRKELNRQTGRHGLFFPPDPGADATIGGMIANNSSGVQTVKYGATRDYVMRLEIVLPGGRVIHSGCRAPKTSSGYDLTRLFVGSEGTLGVITEATLRLTGLPAHVLATTVTFPDLSAAVKAVALMIGAGLAPAALELLTPGLIELMNREKDLGLPLAPSLFCEFHGISPAHLEETAALARQVCEDCGADGFRHATEEGARLNLWRARHEAWETIHRAHPGLETLIVDAAVPISRYPEMALFADEQVKQHNTIGYVFGHAGDGNLHVVMAGDPQNPDEWGRLEAVNHAIVEAAVKAGGTCTGEHGVGIGKSKFMELEHGEGLKLMREIKNLIDPKGLLNPGKMFSTPPDQQL